MTLGKVCKHGALKRQCNTCDIQSQIDVLTAERDHWKARAKKLKFNLKECATIEAVCVLCQGALAEYEAEVKK